jgi:catechol 2,3-dioxygenase-like lactoylglutathione lyase family enzyme
MPKELRIETVRVEEQSMTVLKVDFVGIRSDRLDETVALFRDVLGVSVNRQTDDLVAFKFADGTVLELYGPANEFHSFFTTGPVVAFRVDNFDVARRAMLAAGVKFIGDVQMPTASAGSISTVQTARSWRLAVPGKEQTRERRDKPSLSVAIERPLSCA